MAAPAELEYVLRTIAQTAVDREKEFGDLDAVVGDGDFGYSLARGFENVLSEWDSYDRADAATLLQKVALTISKRVGGTSGPIWGTAFLRASVAAKGKDELDRADVVDMLRAAIEGIKARGKSDVGDKTLLDALVPMADAIENAEGQDAATTARTAATAARTAADATSSMQAMRGRASYSGERSIGSPDAGAVGVAVMAEEVAAGWPQ
jgi:dihydroxyacetone kinase-like protein